MHLRKSIKRSLIICFSFFSISYAQEIESPTLVEASFDHHEESCLPMQDRIAIKNSIHENRQLLISKGLLSNTNTRGQIKFIWPLVAEDGFRDPGFYAISNFVDHNHNADNLMDYSCGNRSYDLQSGYNHEGTDIFLWPYSWHKMHTKKVKIVAAAAGTIIFKQDGNSDENCQFNQGKWNAVYIEHEGGLQSWYGHMKKGSLTDKEVGDKVEAGEFLGYVGSSGNSTGPHLHFEVYDGDGKLLDPFEGSCNSTISESMWKDQQPYFSPELNRIATHGKPPVLSQCEEEINEQESFNPGSLVYFATYFKEVVQGQELNFEILRPDGSTFNKWVYEFTPEYYNAGYLYYALPFALDADTGKWIFRVGLEDQIVDKEFLLTEADISSIDEHEGDQINLYPNPVKEELSIDISGGHVGEYLINIYDGVGNLSVSVALEKDHPLLHYDLDTHDLAEGMYYVNIISEHLRVTKKVMVVH